MATASSDLRIRQTFRVWYEYLQYAKKCGLVVSSDYDEWGDTSVSFSSWWDRVGFELAGGGLVTVATSEHLQSEAHYVFAVPRHLSPRQARVQCEALVKKLHNGITPQAPQSRWSIDPNVPLKLEFFRAYLRAIKSRDRLIRRGQSGSSVEILADLRGTYLDKRERYGESAEQIPQRLRSGDGGFVRDSELIIVGELANPLDATPSVIAIPVYLRHGERILKGVADGKFPVALER